MFLTSKNYFNVYFETVFLQSDFLHCNFTLVLCLKFWLGEIGIGTGPSILCRLVQRFILIQQKLVSRFILMCAFFIVFLVLLCQWSSDMHTY